ncbi:MAG: glycoside hydrolase family 3 protein [Bdellovibrionales bacterium]|nr:glycoside hydrolase family 3 protein [Bdellovibrionales bacterium]
MKISSFVAVLFCLVFGCATQAQELTLEQKIGQTMIWSFPGQEFSPEIQRTLTKYQPGALIVFRRNVKSALQVAQLNSDLQRFASRRLKAPLFLMVDQEGGLVTRVRTSTPMPSALALSKMEDTDFIGRYAQATAEALRAIGFNVNLAPVLDISNPKKDSFIGNRTFGVDPSEVAKITLAYSRGLSAGGILPTAKHFPGHGGTTQDSHRTTPRKMSTREELEQKDLVPFNEFTAADFGRAVMMAHLALPNIDPSGLPSTYSTVMIQEQLRTAMGYKGLIITDDLEMNGASVAKDIGERAVKAFLAGNDMLMFAGPPAHQRRAFNAMLAAVKGGRISKERLDESVQRILAAKAGLPVPEKFDARKALTAFKKLDGMSKEVLKRNFKIASEQSRRNYAAAQSGSTATVFSASYLFFRKFENKFKGKARFVSMGPKNLETVRAEINSGRAEHMIFFASGSKSARWLDTLSAEEKSKLIVVNCNHPGEIDKQTQFKSVLNINSYFSDSGLWLAEWLNQSPDMRTPAMSEAAPPSIPEKSAPTTSPFSEENHDLRMDEPKPENPPPPESSGNI